MSNLNLLQAEWRKLYDQHPFLAGWRLVIDPRSSKRAGCCKYRQRHITVSLWHIQHSEWSAVRNTLLHEIAHVAAGPFAKHGPLWKAQAIRFGAIPEACYTGGQNGYSNKHLVWRFKCATHGDIGGSARRPSWLAALKHDPYSRVCRKCRKPIEVWHNGTKVAGDSTAVFNISDFFPLPKMAAEAPRRQTSGSQTFLFACLHDGIRCSNSIGSREHRMGIAHKLRRLPYPMTKDEASSWLRKNPL